MREIIIQVLMAFFGALGYGLIFRMKLDKLFLGAVGGGLTWIVYLLVKQWNSDVFIGFLISTIFATIYAEVLARVKKAPTTIFVLPAVVPLIPGSGLYYTMQAAILGNFNEFQTMGIQTLKMALAIAGGILVVGVCLHLVEQIYLKFLKIN